MAVEHGLTEESLSARRPLQRCQAISPDPFIHIQLPSHALTYQQQHSSKSESRPWPLAHRFQSQRIPLFQQDSQSTTTQLPTSTSPLRYQSRHRYTFELQQSDRREPPPEEHDQPKPTDGRFAVFVEVRVDVRKTAYRLVADIGPRDRLP